MDSLYETFLEISSVLESKFKICLSKIQNYFFIKITMKKKNR